MICCECAMYFMTKDLSFLEFDYEGDRLFQRVNKIKEGFKNLNIVGINKNDEKIKFICRCCGVKRFGDSFKVMERVNV